jgi:gamma-glutamyltranspeptidase/glutathione hydrolase
MVVSYHPLASQAGERVLGEGGNAFDAFIATTTCEYVLTEGVTRAAGPLCALVYCPVKHETVYLDGYFNNPANPEGRWSASQPALGKAVPVPGAIRALEALSRRYGKLTFSKCLQPAIRLADQGFVVTPLYAALLRYDAVVMSRSAYARATFFRDGQPLHSGDTIRLPEVADFFRHLAREGADYMYCGSWAKEMVTLVQAQGGKISLSDLANYRPRWHQLTLIIHPNGEMERAVAPLGGD